jgi:hypothetical protein
LERELPGLKIVCNGSMTKLVAYADDVTIILTRPEDIAVVRRTTCNYERASGAKVNLLKSKALALGSWYTEMQIMEIPYCEELKLEGVNMQRSTLATVKRCWTIVSAKLRTQAQAAYNRALSTDLRIRYIHEYLLSRIWYITQLYPPPEAMQRQIDTTISWIIWHGEIFRVPLSSLHKQKEHGGWDNTPSRKMHYTVRHSYAGIEQESRFHHGPMDAKMGNTSAD